LSKNPTFHFKVKHIEIKYHLIRYYVQKEIIDLQFIPTKDKIVHIFKKSFGRKEICEIEW